MSGTIWLPVRILLLILQSAWLALGQIWSNKIRSALTTIGIIIGVASVTAVIAALSGLKASVLTEFESIGTTTIFAGPDLPREGKFRNLPWHKIQFEKKDLENLLENCPSLEVYTPATWRSAEVRYGEQTVENMLVRGINNSWHKIENRTVIDGRPFSIIDEEQGWQVCLITEEVKKELKLDKDCVGQEIQIDGRSFRIVGVVEERISAFDMGRSKAEVYIPYETEWKLWRNHPVILAKAKKPEVAEEAREELRFYLRKCKGLKPGDPDLFRIETVEQVLRQFEKVSIIITTIATGVVGISLLVGGVGIMNIMLVSVSERTREIGLRKAVGAKPSAILLQFLVEAVILCFFGGLLGVLGGQGMPSALANIPKAHLDKAYIPMWAIGLAFGFSALVGIIFGMFPAVKAACLDPIEALRHE